MKFIHAADIHLCLGMQKSLLPPEVAEKHRKQLFSTFGALIDEAAKRSVDALFLSGDIFENQYAKSSDVKYAAELMAKIPNVRIFISCGNHDFLSPGSFYGTVEFPENVTIFPPEMAMFEIEEQNACIYGFSWDRNRYDALPFDFPDPNPAKINILCLHADLKTNSDYLRVNPNTLAGVGFDYVALGHIHKPEFIRKNIAYSGSLEPLDFGEEGDHGFIYGEFDGKELNCEFVPFASHGFKTADLDISEIKSYTELCQKIYEVLPPSPNIMARLTVKGSRNEDIDPGIIIDEISKAYLFFQFRDESVLDYDLLEIYRQNEDNLIGRFTLALMHEAREDGTARRALYEGLKVLLENKGAKS